MNEPRDKPDEAKQPDFCPKVPASIGSQIGAVFEANVDGVVILTASGIEYANPRMGELFGIPLLELRQPNFARSSLPPSPARDEARRVMLAILEGSLPPQEVTFSAMTRHLGERHFTASLTRVPGDEPRCLGIVHDVSDRVNSENRWRLHVQMLAEIAHANQLLQTQDLPLSQVRDSMDILCRATRADRVCLQISYAAALENDAEMANVYVGVGADLPPLSIPSRWQPMLPGTPPVSAVVADLPEEERKPFEAQGVLAFLAFPIVFGDVCRGMVRFDRMSVDILWSKDTVILLSTGINTWSNSLMLAEIQRALTKSEDRFRRLVENSPDFIYRMALPEGHYEYVSPASLEMTGYTAEEFQSNPQLIQDIIHPGWWNYFQTQWAKLIVGDMPPTYEYAIIHGRTGETRWFHQRNVLLTGENGVPTAIEGIVTDITARKRAEIALHAQESMLQSVFRAAPVGIGLLSDRTILQANDRFCEMTGYTAAELAGQNARMLYPTEAEYNSVGEAKYSRISDRGAGTFETRFRRKDGHIIHVLLDSTPLDEADLSAGVTFMALDITDRKLAEDQTRDSLQQKDRLVREIRHRFHDDLALIDSLLGLQMVQVDGSAAAQILRRSRARVRAVALIHDHFDRFPDAPSVNMGDIVGVLVKQLVAPRPAPVTTSVSAPNVYLGADQATLCCLVLSELICNALDNAFLADPPTDRPLHIKVTLDECEGHLTLVVEDNRSGMPSSLNRGRESGLEMDVVALLVGHMGGRCETGTHQGTRVVVSFPRRVTAQERL